LVGQLESSTKVGLFCFWRWGLRALLIWAFGEVGAAMRRMRPADFRAIEQEKTAAQFYRKERLRNCGNMGKFTGLAIGYLTFAGPSNLRNRRCVLWVGGG
jgi:hypothetical protein